MDKLVREYLASSLRYLKARDLVEEDVRRYLEILKGIPLQYVVRGKLMGWGGSIADSLVAAPQVSKSQMVSATT